MGAILAQEEKEADSIFALRLCRKYFRLQHACTRCGCNWSRIHCCRCNIRCGHAPANHGATSWYRHARRHDVALLPLQPEGRLSTARQMPLKKHKQSKVCEEGRKGK